ncbi:glycosidase [Caldicellulosiruptor changbaiensis]|uniref:Glycosidase n=1 Tax=Caldicellulosiruptor changbaiensis TaxID=1222016 RepID=A0A3T0D986_9FIRM|nr:glycosidase [Caldicellulosiruptor changbaiensis]AZT91604.1 glycosidase [Caldicellulosiruptor changbaiensis]
MFKLKRLVQRPVLEPIEENHWESKAVFNAAAVYHNGYIHLLYRACNNTFEALSLPYPDEKYKFVSSIGYAKSKDGINFERLSVPVVTGRGVQEAWGVEDPRITYLDGKFYMVYTAFGGRSWEDVRISMIYSDDLIHWSTEHQVLLDEPNKDGALHPEKVNGKYMLYHRRPPSIWVAFSEDLKNWHDHKIIMTPRENSWDSQKIGIAGPPILIDDGWLLIYHGVDENRVYRLGAALLDRNNPTKVIARQEEPILEPELEWEKNGLVPNVVFSCGQCIVDGILFVYYGACDTCIGVAAVEVDKIKF